MNLKLDIWEKSNYQDFLNYLSSFREETYKNLQKKTINTKYEILGVRLPLLRKIAKKISQGNIQSFLKFNDFRYYEEVMIRGLVIAQIKDKTIFLDYFGNYLNLIDNWAICDSVVNSLILVKQNAENLKEELFSLLNSAAEYSVRVGLVAILNFYIKKEYLNEIFYNLNNLKLHSYYIDMAAAWLIAELYINYKKETLKFLKKNNLNDFTHNKAIQKIRESYRVSKEEKERLKDLKRGNYATK